MQVQSRRLISSTLFVLAVPSLSLGLIGGQWSTGLSLGGALAVGDLIFYRRGK